MSVGLTRLMTVVLLIVGGFAVCALVALIPLRLPWPLRLRWMIATNSLAAAEPLGRPLSAQAMDMREVRLVVEECKGDCAWVWIGSAHGTSWTRHAPLDAAASMATIERWSAGRTPLLCIAHGSGELSLDASGEAVCDLRPVGTELARAA